MDLKAKRKREIEIQKDKRIGEVVSAAVEVFKKKGIENTKMTDIAAKAEVGVASIYRYFKTKPELVIEAGTKIWKNEISYLYDACNIEDLNKLMGSERVNEILGVFQKLYADHRDFIRFIEEFDNYIVKEHISPERLEGYEKIITGLKASVFEAMESGKRDGSIRMDIDNNEFYNTITHGLMSLCQKLTLRGGIIKSDWDIEGMAQIKLLTDMAVKYISNN